MDEEAPGVLCDKMIPLRLKRRIYKTIVNDCGNKKLRNVLSNK